MIEKRILVLEDEKNWQQFFTIMLQKEGRRISLVETVSQAKDNLRRQTFHVIVADLRLNHLDSTNLDGLLFLKWLKTEYPGELSHQIVLTAFPTVEATKDAFKECHVSDMIVKGDAGFEQQLNETIDRALKPPKDFEHILEKSRFLRRRTFDDTLILRILHALPDCGTNEVLSKGQLEAFLETVFPQVYVPFSKEVIGPEIVSYRFPLVRLVLWSRECNVAVAGYLMQGESAERLTSDVLEFERKLRPKPVVRLEIRSRLFGTSCLLPDLAFEEFCGLIPEG